MLTCLNLYHKKEKVVYYGTFFTPIGGEKAKCKQTCSYKTSTSNLKRHIQRRHISISFDKGIENVQENDNIEEIGNKLQDDLKPESSTGQVGNL